MKFLGRLFLLFCFVSSGAFLSMAQSAFATTLPFTDVQTTDDYYQDLMNLYERGIIPDSPNNKFNPDSLMNRDEFVAIVVGVGCKKCLSPSFEDILKYTQLPFVDFKRDNPTFYCVSYAKEMKIVEGYVTGPSGKNACEDGVTYDETPFCAFNKITRIEAAAVLLRQAGLWTIDLNNSPFEKTVKFTDVPDSWYGYAQKAVQIGMIKMDSAGKVRPEENITKREFVRMAANIFRNNLCSVREPSGNVDSDISSEIRILDTGASCGTETPITDFNPSSQTAYTFFGRTQTPGGPYNYDWEFVRVSDGKKLSGSGACLKDFDLGWAGTWLVRLTVSDPITGKKSQSLASVEVRDGTPLSPKAVRGLSVNIRANILDTTAPYPVQFSSVVAGGVGPYRYRWDFSDGTFSTEENPLHLFNTPGVKPVSLTVVDSRGSTAIASVVLVFTKSSDDDHDGIPNDDDDCPSVFGPVSNKGCPVIKIYHPIDPQEGGGGTGSGGTGGGWTWSGSIGGGWSGNPNSTLTVVWTNGQCHFDNAQEQWALFGQAACSACPCKYSVDYTAEIRSCDILFPTILSPDKSTLYSRGKVFEVRF